VIGLLAVARTLYQGARGFVHDPKSRGVATVALGLILGGAFFYRRVEDLSWIDSFYFTIVTLTTVGYGDISPQTTAGKLFTMAYLVIGIGIMVALITEVANHLIKAASREERDSSSPG